MAALLPWLERSAQQQPPLEASAETAAMLQELAARSVLWINCHAEVLRANRRHAGVALVLLETVVRTLHAAESGTVERELAVGVVMGQGLPDSSDAVVAGVLPYAVALMQWRAGTAPCSLEAVHEAAHDRRLVRYSAWSLDAVLRLLFSRGWRTSAARTAMRLLLPRFFEAVPAETETMCMERLLRHGPATYTQTKRLSVLSDALCACRPALLALHGIDGERDGALRRLYTRCGLLTAAKHPRITASLLCTDKAHHAARFHACTAQQCAWWQALCEHLLALHSRQGVGEGRPPLLSRAQRNTLLAALRHSRRFAECVRLCAHGVLRLSANTLTDKHDRLLAAGPHYTALDVADALRERESVLDDDDALAAPCRSEQQSSSDACASYIMHVELMHVPCALGYPLPRWTPDTHAALYSKRESLHCAIYTLFVVHCVRPHSALAPLPYELLFLLFEYVTIARCAQPQ